MPRKLVLCLDGTSNEPETGTTNVARMFQVAAEVAGAARLLRPRRRHDGRPRAVTPFGRRLTRLAGLVADSASRTTSRRPTAGWSSTGSQATDLPVRVLPRGLHRACAGRDAAHGRAAAHGADNLSPYALKLYAKKGDENASEAQEKEFWRVRRGFGNHFGEPEFPNPFDTSQHQVHFLGVWDTVKSVGWLNWKARFEQARWPFTAKISERRDGSARDGDRRTASAVPRRTASTPGWWPRRRGGSRRSGSPACTATWAASSRTTGCRTWPSTGWSARPRAAGLLVDEKAYKRLVGHAWDKPAPADLALGRDPPEPRWVGAGWWLAGRTIRPGDTVHPSVQQRIDATRDSANPYRPRPRSHDVP